MTAGRHDLPPAEHAPPRVQHALERRRIFDLGPPVADPGRGAWERESGGPVVIETHTVHAGEMLERDPQRYVSELPAGVEPGPKSGEQRIRYW
jgi:hypothetical protein